MSHTEKAIVVTEPKEAVVDTITVNEVKKLIGEQVEKPKQELIAYDRVQMDDGGNFISINFSLNQEQYLKLTKANLVILTYANCFVMTPLSQTGEARVAGNLVYDDEGNATLAQVGFKLTEISIIISTNVKFQFDFNKRPTAYIFALSF